MVLPVGKRGGDVLTVGPPRGNHCGDYTRAQRQRLRAALESPPRSVPLMFAVLMCDSGELENPTR
jgi:hypothetical protein